MKRVFTIGDSFINFIPNKNEQKGKLKDIINFEKTVGGSDANIAAGISKLGGKSVFIGMVGQDEFGDYLIETLKYYGVDTSYIKRTSKTNTGIAFVSEFNNENREEFHYREASADMMLSHEDILENWFRKGDIIHFSSSNLMEESVKLAYQKIVFLSKKLKNIISFAPNIKWHLKVQNYDYRKAINEIIPYTDILKLNSYELEYLTLNNNEEESIQTLMRGSVKVIIITKGEKGTTIYCKDLKIHCYGVKVKVLDTSGVDDGFMAGLLYKLASSGKDMNNLTIKDLRIMVKYANIIGALTTMKRGVIGALPDIHRVSNYFIKIHEESNKCREEDCKKSVMI